MSINHSCRDVGRPHLLFLAALLLLSFGLCPAARLGAETTSYSGAVELTALPASITVSGTYYLTRDFNVNLSGGVAITVTAPNVTLDLNGHTITNTAGTANTACAIYIQEQSGASVRRGALAGFQAAVATTPNSAGALLEDLRLSAITNIGLSLSGKNPLVRRCRVQGVGGATFSGYNGQAFGVIAYGEGARVLDCDFSAVQGSTLAFSLAIYFANGLTDGLAQGNRISRSGNGIIYAGSATGKYRDNLCAGSVTTPYTGGTDAGGNN